MTTFELYGTWNRMLKQWLSHVCHTRRTNLIWLVIGLYLGQGVQAGRIVAKWPLAAKATSLTRRLSRFLDNGAIRPAVWYRPVARHVLERWAGGTVTLIIDATQVGAGHQLVMVALAYRRRALPLAWSWVPYIKGHVASAVQLAVLQRVAGLMPAGVSVILTGDSGFASVALIRQLNAWGWQYALRQLSKHQVRPSPTADWVNFGQLVRQPGQAVWWSQADFTLKWAEPTSLLAYWAQGEAEAWLLTTNLPDARTARQVYARRMWIEEMFGDWKGHGWDLQTTHLRHPDRLSRLLLAICLLYVWLVLYGVRVIKAGWRDSVDRHDRRDLSIFRIGSDTLQRCFTLDRRPPVALPNLLAALSVG
jgi:hypothetical protein